MKLTFILMFVTLTSFGQIKVRGNQQSNAKPVELQDTTRIGLLRYDSSINDITMFHNCYGDFGFNDHDFATIDSILKETINEYNLSEKQKSSSLTINAIDLKNYERQYMMVTNPGGNRLVWVNCFCRNKGHANWPKPIVVAKGGKCYFNFVINLSTGVHTALKVNPED